MTHTADVFEMVREEKTFAGYYRGCASAHITENRGVIIVCPSESELIRVLKEGIPPQKFTAKKFHGVAVKVAPDFPKKAKP